MQANLTIEIPEEFIALGIEKGLSNQQISEHFADFLQLITYERVIPEHLEEILADFEEQDIEVD